MQFHTDGFRPGDPEVQPRLPGLGDISEQHEVDVVIVGAGPAGLLLAAQLAAFPEISYRVLERRPQALEKGQADGVACRTVEMFQAFGMGERLVREAYWVNETAFWGPDADDSEHIACTGRVQDVEDGLSEFPHLIVNQARLQDYLIEVMGRSPRRIQPEYGTEVLSTAVDAEGEYPVLVRARGIDGADVQIRAKYAVGADGAGSMVRKSMGLKLKGDAQNKVWGVLDVLAETDFPDIRRKCVISRPRLATSV